MTQRPEKNYSDAVCQPFLLEGGKHGVLLLHGFTGTIAQLRPLAERLHQSGFTVMGVNLPGHALSMEAMAACTWQDWLDAAKDALLTLKARCEWTSVAGLSMGGCLTLLLAEQMQPTAAAVISTPMGTRAPLWMTGPASLFVKKIWWRKRSDSTSPVDDRYDYGYPGFCTKCGPHLNRLIKMARRDLHAVTCPVLAVQSRADETITADSAEVILRGVSSERKEMMWLNNAPHVCTLTGEVQQIAEGIAAHFRQAERS